MERWTDERVWDAVDAWRWIPPPATRVVTPEFELFVTPGAYALTYVYGFSVADPALADARLRDIRERVLALGGNGARFRWSPRNRPADLPERLERQGYRLTEEGEVLVWELADERGAPRYPPFPDPSGIVVREVLTDAEFETFLELATPIFGDPTTPEALAAFRAEFRRTLRAEGRSDRFLAWEGPSAVGRAGLELVGKVARLWGTGVLPSHRRRGAYGALVRARLESAASRGAEIGLVVARVGTSGPILKRRGFRPVGAVRTYEARF